MVERRLGAGGGCPGRCQKRDWQGHWKQAQRQDGALLWEAAVRGEGGLQWEGTPPQSKPEVEARTS